MPAQQTDTSLACIIEAANNLDTMDLGMVADGSFLSIVQDWNEIAEIRPAAMKPQPAGTVMTSSLKQIWRSYLPTAETSSAGSALAATIASTLSACATSLSSRASRHEQHP